MQVCVVFECENFDSSTCFYHVHSNDKNRSFTTSQENHNRSKTQVLFVSSSGVLNTSVSHASDREISSSGHEHEIQQESGLHVMLDHEVMGVGGDNSWEPCVHEKYLVRLSLSYLTFTCDTHTTHKGTKWKDVHMGRQCDSHAI